MQHTQSSSIPTSGPVTARAPTGTWLIRLPLNGSLLVDKRALFAASLLTLLLLISIVVSLCLGATNYSPAEVLDALFGESNPMTAFILNELRLPRVIAGILSGAGFALAGCLMQTLARNRLATPGIIGIDNGATAFAVASVVGLVTSLATTEMALIGAATATALAFGLAGGAGVRGYRFIIAGIGIGALFGAFTQLMLARAHIDVANQAYPWTVGSLNARPENAVLILAVGLAIGLVGALFLARALKVLRFSEPVARGLGVRVNACRYTSLVLAVALTAMAVAVAGPVGLVGLIGPEIARHLSSTRSVPLISSALAGALVMVLADTVGRMMLMPLEVPVGIVTAIVGGPYLLWILLVSPRNTP